MITPSLESTSCLNAGIVEPVLPSVLNRGNALFCPSCPLSRENSHVVAFLTDWCQICLLLISSNTHCQLQCIPWLGLVLFQIGWWTPLFRQRSLLEILSHIVGHSSKLCWKNNVNSLLRAKLGEQVSLVIPLALFGSWDFHLFQRLLDEAGYEDKHLLHDISCLLSLVLRLFPAYCLPNLCTQPCLCPSFGLRCLNAMLKCSIALVLLVTSSWIVAQVTKHTKSLPLASWTGPYNSLEECPGEYKVLVRRKPRWQSGDVRKHRRLL